MSTLSPHDLVKIARRRCAEKRRYYSWWEAERAALDLIEAIRDGRVLTLKAGLITGYKCPFGEHWHVGHSTANSLARLRQALALTQPT